MMMLTHLQKSVDVPNTSSTFGSNVYATAAGASSRNKPSLSSGLTTKHSALLIDFASMYTCKTRDIFSYVIFENIWS